MELRDFIVTPIILILVYAVAYIVRPYFTNAVNRKYFFPALSMRIAGAIAVGFIYQFYYQGGDTFNYHTLGSRVVWNFFYDDPLEGIRLIFGTIKDDASIYKYSTKILFFNDPSAFTIIRISSFLDLFTFSTYSATAVLFSVISFAGGWAFFLTFTKKYPHLHFPLALAIFFVPSLFFWGSGILKDTIVLAALGFATYLIDRLTSDKKRILWNVIFLLLSLTVIFVVRKFILQAFIPAAMLWLYARYQKSITSMGIRILIFPIIICLVGYAAYWAVVSVGLGDEKYAITNLARTAKITAYDIGFYTGRNAGSHYTLGELDETFLGMFLKAPGAINVTLFRPYLWEAKNPLMVLSAIESAFFMILVIYKSFFKKGSFLQMINNPDIIFLLTFSLILALAVGITSYNFGTLSRYKIALVPFFLSALVIFKSKNPSQPEGENV